MSNIQATKSYNNYTKGQQFNKWSEEVSKNPQKESEFVVTTNTDSDGFVGDFVELTKSYIKEYDSDGDGAISYEEFKAKETATAKENNAKEPDEQTLKAAFNRLNVVQDGEYADKLSEKEIFNYFIGMDALEDADGKITSSEYAMMALSIADTSKDEKSAGTYVTEYLKDTYKSIFGEN